MIVKIEHLSKSYQKGKIAVDDLSLEIEEGDIYGFIGQNGAGKSTTLKSMVGIIPFEKGNIYYQNHSIKTDAFECKKMFAFIPDTPELYPHMSGIGYLNFIGDIYRIKKDVRKQRIQYYSNAFLIEAQLNQPIASYSHGMKQKLLLVAAFMHAPKILILDEPFIGLDPISIHTLKREMKEYVSKGNAIFFSSHVLDFVEKLCNKIAIIQNGKLIASGLIDEVKGNESLEEFFMELSQRD